jgi:hypothetical protein
MRRLPARLDIAIPAAITTATAKPAVKLRDAAAASATATAPPATAHHEAGTMRRSGRIRRARVDALIGDDRT